MERIISQIKSNYLANGADYLANGQRVQGVREAIVVSLARESYNYYCFFFVVVVVVVILFFTLLYSSVATRFQHAVATRLNVVFKQQGKTESKIEAKERYDCQQRP